MEPTPENIEASKELIKTLEVELEQANVLFQEANNNPDKFPASVIADRARFAKKAKDDLSHKKAELDLLLDKANNK